MKISLAKVQKFFDNHPNNQTKNFKQNHEKPIIRILQLCLGIEDDVIKCLKDPEAVAKKILDKYTNTNTVKFYFQALLFLIDNYPGLDAKIGRGQYYDYWLGSKVMKAEEDLAKPPIDNIDYDDIKEKVNDQFGLESEESLFIDFYEQAPLRLDFHDIYVNDKTKSNNLDLKTKKLTMKVYNKTSDKYGDKIIPLTQGLIDKVGRFKTSGKLFSFSRTTQGAKIKRILQESGIDGSMNTLRHSVHSKDMTPAERVELARRSGHAPETSVMYKRTNIKKLQGE